MRKNSIFMIALAVIVAAGSAVMAKQAVPARTEDGCDALLAISENGSGMMIARGGPMMDPDGDRDEGVRERHHGRRMFGDPERMRKELDLSDEQIDKIEAINDKYFEEHKKIRDKIRPKMRTLRDLLVEDKVDLEKVRAVLKEISEYQIENRMLLIRQHIEIETVLTKEQRDKVRRDRHEMFERGMMMRGW
jgi:Spy/CpxP family protein refolding chaperone